MPVFKGFHARPKTGSPFGQKRTVGLSKKSLDEYNSLILDSADVITVNGDSKITCDVHFQHLF